MGGGRLIFGKRIGIGARTKEVQKTIGIVGVSRGTGTTFSMMMMAYYAKQVMKAKTAVVERNSTGHLLSLCKEEQVVSIRGIDILRELDTIPRQYSYLFFDYGTRIGQTQKTFPRFLDCSIKLVTASITLWKQEELFRFVEAWSSVQGNEEWIYLIPFASFRAVREMEKQLGRTMYAITPEQEWWRMGVENLTLWDKILL